MHFMLIISARFIWCSCQRLVNPWMLVGQHREPLNDAETEQFLAEKSVLSKACPLSC